MDPVVGDKYESLVLNITVIDVISQFYGDTNVKLMVERKAPSLGLYDQFSYEVLPLEKFMSFVAYNSAYRKISRTPANLAPPIKVKSAL